MNLEIKNLLIEELSTIHEETQARSWINSDEQPLMVYMQRLVSERNLSELVLLAEGHSPIHNLLSNREKLVRAVARLALALSVDDEVEATVKFDAAVSSLADANRAPAVDVDWSSSVLLISGRDSRIARLSKRDRAHLAMPIILHLDRAVPRRITGPSVNVLFDNGRTGSCARLRLYILPDLPTCLAPDPASMTLFSGDERFRDSLAAAWRVAGGRRRGAIFGRSATRTGPLVRSTGRVWVRPSRYSSLSYIYLGIWPTVGSILSLCLPTWQWSARLTKRVAHFPVSGTTSQSWRLRRLESESSCRQPTTRWRTLSRKVGSFCPQGRTAKLRGRAAVLRRAQFRELLC